MFTQTLTRAWLFAQAKHDEAMRTLATQAAHGVDLESDEGADDSVWKIFMILFIVALATGVFLRIYNAIKTAGDAAAGQIGGSPYSP